MMNSKYEIVWGSRGVLEGVLLLCALVMLSNTRLFIRYGTRTTGEIIKKRANSERADSGPVNSLVIQFFVNKKNINSLLKPS
jgi:hypothetical protein